MTSENAMASDSREQAPRMRELLGDLRGRALGVLAACLVCQMGLGIGYGFGPLAPGMLAELGWSRALLSSAQAPQAWVIAFASPLVGWLVARQGARAVLCAGAIVLGAACAGFAAAQAWWQLALAWAFVGLGVTGLGDIAVGAVVSQWVTRSRGLALGIVYTGSNLGGFLATRGMVAVAGEWSWRIGVASAALCAFAILLPAAWLGVRDRRRPGAFEEEGGPAPADDATPGDLDVGAALGTRSFWIVAFTLLGFWIYLYAVLAHFSLALVDGGMTGVAAGGHLANAVGMGLVSKIAFGWIADRLSAKRAVLLDYGLLALSSLLLLAVPGGEGLAVWAFVLVFGFSYAARDVVTPLILVHCFGSRHLAELYGVLMLTILPGGTLGPILAGWTHDQTGSYALAFAGLAVWSGLSFALLFAVRDERRTRTG